MLASNVSRGEVHSKYRVIRHYLKKKKDQIDACRALPTSNESLERSISPM